VTPLGRLAGPPVADDPRADAPAPPYSSIALVYDAVLGGPFFARLERVFDELIRRHDIAFTSAADVACGTGILVRHLRRAGVPVVYGVDRSPAMLRVAAARNRGNGARFLLQDFASLSLPHRVDLITSTFDSLNYLLTTRELGSALRRFHANLGPGGHAIFDMITTGQSHGAANPLVERVRLGNSILVRVTSWDAQRALQSAVVLTSYCGRWRREVHVQRGYPIRVVASLLVATGFDVLAVDDFDTLGPAGASTTRALYVARARPRASRAVGRSSCASRPGTEPRDRLTTRIGQVSP
jgi:SAM-dependent methyltransferase